MYKFFRLNFLAIDKIDKAGRTVKGTITILLLIAFVMLSNSGMIFRTISLVCSLVFAILIALWTFGVGAKYDD